MPITAEKLTLLSPSIRLGSAALFRAHGATSNVDDAVASALFRGELEAAMDETLALAAAEEGAGAEGLDLDDGALQASSERFRYEHDLISAGETEAWLDARGMTTDDFSRWLYQRLCRSASESGERSAIPDDFPDLLRIHLWLSGEMETLVKRLRRRIAADLELAQRGEPVSGSQAMKRFLDHHRFDQRDVSEWLSALGRDRSWLETTARIESAFDRLVVEALTEKARTAKLKSMQISLARIEIETLELDSDVAAREAVLCVHDDGTSLAAVARDAGYHADRVQMWADELALPFVQRLLGAAEGEVVGPIELYGRFAVHQLLRKIEPSLADPAVSERVDAAVIDDQFDNLCSRHTQ